MIVIRTAEDMARALDSPLDPELLNLLQVHRARLAEWQDYDLQDLALFVIVQPPDTLADIEGACSWRLVQVGGGAATFAICPEIIQRHAGWIEVTFILSDDGFGLVLLVSIAEGTNPTLLAACNKCVRRDG
jgi:hypothetical protein